MNGCWTLCGIVGVSRTRTVEQVNDSARSKDGVATASKGLGFVVR